jgi:hypothetical protein
MAPPDGQPDFAAPPRRDRRRTVVRLVLVILLLAAVGFALAGIVPGSSGRLANVSVGWLLVAVGAETVSLLAYTGLFYGVFGPGQPQVGVVRSAQIAVGELGAFAVVPTGAGGPVLRVWALLASGVQFRRLVVRSVAHSVIFNLPYILVAAVLGLGVVFDMGPGDAPVAVALAPGGVVLVALASRQPPPATPAAAGVRGSLAVAGNGSARRSCRRSPKACVRLDAGCATRGCCWPRLPTGPATAVCW